MDSANNITNTENQSQPRPDSYDFDETPITSNGTTVYVSVDS